MFKPLLTRLRQLLADAGVQPPLPLPPVTTAQLQGKWTPEGKPPGPHDTLEFRRLAGGTVGLVKPPFCWDVQGDDWSWKFDGQTLQVDYIEQVPDPGQDYRYGSYSGMRNQRCYTVVLGPPSPLQQPRRVVALRDQDGQLWVRA